ncbi:hypothetical protein F511_32976 [Dorcoceras hygrometricum]|uniref:CCHC-type domain-containing protein n=1 Tax=Dorcoceras hygrometricum TaxID=472368 RepID=A0A2Z7BLT6_9LAMI|nr:hypothetical protein F511_32976 [Dorcoceras hygrometricum]
MTRRTPQAGPDRHGHHGFIADRGVDPAGSAPEGVQGSCNICGQYGHFERVCPLAGSQHTAAPPQGPLGGSSRDRPFLAPHQRLGEPQFRPFQQSGPSRFGQSSQPQFSGPQFAQLNAMTREQEDGIPTGVIADSIGYPRMRASGESSTTRHRLLHASGPHPIPPPNDPKMLVLEDERVTPVYLISLLGSVSHYERSCCSPYWGLTACPSGVGFIVFLCVFSGHHGFTAGRGVDPAGSAAGGG